MICFANLYESLTVLAVVLLLFYIFVCLPDNSFVARLFVSILCSFIVFGMIAAFLPPDYIPSAPLTVGSTYFGLILGFMFLAYSLSELLIASIAIIVSGPLLLAARDHIEQWFEYQFGWHIGQFGVLLICISLVLFTLFLFLYVRKNELIWDIVKCILFGLFALISIKFLIITVDQNHPSEYCCSGESTETCVFVFLTIDWVLLLFLIIFRLLLLLHWRDIEKALKTKQNNKTNTGWCSCCCLCNKNKKDKYNKKKQKKSDNDNDEQQQQLLVVDKKD